MPCHCHVYNQAMSKLAGIILLIMGVFFVYLGANEILHPESLTRNASYATTGAGVILVITGLLHFKAPHKAFLVSIPFLLLFQFVVFLVAHYFYEDKRWLYYQILVGVVSLLTLWVSYRGYVEQKDRTV